MTFVWTEDQRAVRDSLRSLLEKNVDVTAEGIGGNSAGVGGAAWRRLAEEVGALAIGIPEDHGGAGFGFAEQAAVFAESGRLLAPRGLFSTMALAAPALLLAGEVSIGAKLLPDLAIGSRAATLAITDSPAQADVNAVLEGDTWRLTGIRKHVTDAVEVDIVLTPAVVDSRPALFAVNVTDTGLTVDPTNSLDGSRPLADVHFASAEAVLIGTLDGGAALLERVRNRAVIALAFEQVGGAQRCLDMASEYARTRKQFGRPVGSFQSVKHLLSDVLVAVETAAAAAQHASAAVDGTDLELRRESAIAGLLASEAYVQAAGVNIQVHGGIGFTWEHPAHLYFKRATVSRAFLGSPAQHRETLAGLAFT